MGKQSRMTETDRIRFDRMNRIRLAIAKKDFATAKKEIDHLLEAEPLDPFVRLYVSACLELMGDKEGALREALLAIILESAGDVAGLMYPRVARLLARQGKTKEARRILEIGWEKVKSLYPKHLRDEEKKEYFKIE